MCTRAAEPSEEAETSSDAPQSFFASLPSYIMDK